MKQSGHVIITLALSAFVISCSSGSSSQSASPRKAAKRLGESSAPAATSGESATATPKTEPAAGNVAADPAAAQTLRTLYINVASANVRSMPSKEATIVAKMKFLDPVGATGMLDGEWVQVEVTMPDGAIGKAWIHSTLVSASKEQAEAVKAAAGGK
jgi:hypothetical protein